MNIVDSIYGTFEVDGVLEELINCDAVQRLKDIHQGGGTYLVNPRWNVTRYEHSVGVMILIKLLGGSIEEQIAGLLHDVSHTAFSHVADIALEYEDEDYHEKIYGKIVEESSIPRILEKYGFDKKEILYNEENFTILEKSAPKLCADRVDYTLRDMYHYGDLCKDEIKGFLGNLTVENGEIVNTKVEWGVWFTRVYYDLALGYFLDPLNIYSYHFLGEAIKRSLKLNLISLDDLVKTDHYLLNKMREGKDEEVNNLLNALNFKAKAEENFTEYDITQHKKVRLIDPTVFKDGKLYKTTELSEKAREMQEEAVARYKKGVFVKILES